jgi:hypothetical protein
MSLQCALARGAGGGNGEIGGESYDLDIKMMAARGGMRLHGDEMGRGIIIRV